MNENVCKVFAPFELSTKLSWTVDVENYDYCLLISTI